MKKWILNHPANFFLIAALLAVLVLWIFDINDKGFAWHDILVEAHGMFFDLIVFGILLALYEQFKNKNDSIKRHNEELDDYRGWTEAEAAYRVAGIVRRLKKIGVKEIDFSNLHFGRLDTNSIIEQIQKETPIGSLEGANLKGASLPKADLMGLNMQHSNLEEINLKDGSLTTSNLNWANLINANLQEVYLWSTNLEHTDFSGANLQEAMFNDAIATNARLEKANLNRADLVMADFSHAYLIDASLIEAELSYTVLRKADLRGVNLQRANIHGANFQYANLKKANLNAAVLNEVNLQGANLIGVDWTNAVLMEVDLNEAHVAPYNWFALLKKMRVNEVEAIESKYYIEHEQQTDNYGDIFFKIKKKE